ncbi:glycerol ethanol, ferric requiring protein [Perkinsus chesapeaki]|uniref:Glycerol ethanol, ferric requiring protein n=1 Tax=Perkinsus chesapeaki TaxID=330153 RepID=A0A7J6LEE2_PERCH|nr:glycerol ethanol, ferric requiring protein [Perkinsus chesapeaki]
MAGMDKQIKDLNAKLYEVGPVRQAADLSGLAPVGVCSLLAGAFVGSLCLLTGFAVNTVCNLVGFCYPVYKSYQVVEQANPTNEQTKAILTYWTVFGGFMLVEAVIDNLLFWVPLYYFLRVGFQVYLFYPDFRGSAKLYSLAVKPTLTHAAKLSPLVTAKPSYNVMSSIRQQPQKKKGFRWQPTLACWAIAIWFQSTDQVDTSLLSRLTGQQLTDLAQRYGVNLVIPANPIGISVYLILVAAILSPLVAAVGIATRSIPKLKSHHRCLYGLLMAFFVIALLAVICCGVLVCICFYGVGIVSDLTYQEIQREIESYGGYIGTSNITHSVELFVPPAMTLYNIGGCTSIPSTVSCSTPQLDSITCPYAPPEGVAFISIVNEICSSLPAVNDYPEFSDRCNSCVANAGSTSAASVACLCGTQLEVYTNSISPEQQAEWRKTAIFNGVTAAIALLILLLWLGSQVICPVCLVRRAPPVVDTITAATEEVDDDMIMAANTRQNRYTTTGAADHPVIQLQSYITVNEDPPYNGLTFTGTFDSSLNEKSSSSSHPIASTERNVFNPFSTMKASSMFTAVPRVAAGYRSCDSFISSPNASTFYDDIPTTMDGYQHPLGGRVQSLPAGEDRAIIAVTDTRVPNSGEVPPPLFRRLRVTTRHHPRGITGFDGPGYDDTVMYSETRGHMQQIAAKKRAHDEMRLQALVSQRKSAPVIGKPAHEYTPLQPLEPPSGWNGMRSWDIPIQTKRVDPMEHPQRFYDTKSRIWPKFVPTWDIERARALRKADTRSRSTDVFNMSSTFTWRDEADRCDSIEQGDHVSNHRRLGVNTAVGGQLRAPVHGSRSSSMEGCLPSNDLPTIQESPKASISLPSQQGSMSSSYPSTSQDLHHQQSHTVTRGSVASVVSALKKGNNNFFTEHAAHSDGSKWENALSAVARRRASLHFPLNNNKQEAATGPHGSRFNLPAPATTPLLPEDYASMQEVESAPTEQCPDGGLRSFVKYDRDMEEWVVEPHTPPEAVSYEARERKHRQEWEKFDADTLSHLLSEGKLMPKRPGKSAYRKLWCIIILTSVLGTILSAVIDSIVRLLVSGKSHLTTWLSILMDIILVITCRMLMIAQPLAEGSGIPEMKCELGGASHLLGFFRPSVLVAKSIGLALVISAGLPVGAEGPMVHISACIGSSLLRLPYFRSVREIPNTRRQVLSAAVATGVAAIFRAPIGGVLFALEVTSNHFFINTYWMCLVASVVGSFVFVCVKTSPLVGLRPFIFSEVHFTNYESPQRVIGFAAYGVILGLLGGYFIKAFSQTGRLLADFQRFWASHLSFRRHKVVPGRGGLRQGQRGPDRQWVEDNNATATIGVDTRNGSSLLVNQNGGDTSFVRPDAISVYRRRESTAPWPYDDSSHDTTTTTNRRPSIVQRIRRRIMRAWHRIISPKQSCIFFLLIILTLINSIISRELPPLVIPSYVLGALIGRLTYEIMPSTTPNDQFFNPSSLALVGTVGFAAAVTQSFSLLVAIYEVAPSLGTGGMLLPLCVATVAGVLVSGQISPSIFDVILLRKNLPGRPALTNQQRGMLPVCAVMTPAKDIPKIQDDAWEHPGDIDPDTLDCHLPKVPVLLSTESGRSILVAAAPVDQLLEHCGEMSPNDSADALCDMLPWLDVSPMTCPPDASVLQVYGRMEYNSEQVCFVTFRGELLGAVTAEDLLYRDPVVALPQSPSSSPSDSVSHHNWLYDRLHNNNNNHRERHHQANCFNRV